MYTELYYQHTVERKHECWGDCNRMLMKGDKEIRYREPSGSCTHGRCIPCFKKMLINGLEEISKL
jgi:hypothetical protein